MMLQALIFGFVSTAGLTLLFNIRKQDIVLAALGGTITSLCYNLLLVDNSNAFGPAFIAALIAGIYSEIMAAQQKTPATTYVIPGIVPLVPGAGMYYTMLYLSERNFSAAAYHGYQTIFVALAIACGIVIAPSIRRLYRQLHRGSK